MTDTKKNAFKVTVQVDYLSDQSSPDDNKFVFSYTVTITNIGNISAQLISRHWVITDANNHVQEVKGLGVVGAQPLLAPGQQFEYTSGTLIDTPVGAMRGCYKIVAENGHFFDAVVEPFTLAVPRMLN